MKLFIIFLVAVALLSPCAYLQAYDALFLRNQVGEAFRHAYGSYLRYGFPYDEVLPITCKPRVERNRGTLDDTLGDYMLTLVDSLDTMIVFGEHHLFAQAILLMDEYSFNFDFDINISVFESNIRVLGGLLSAHQLASYFYDEGVYDGFSLLNHAENLADRLLPAFQTKTGIPLYKINMKYGRTASDNTSIDNNEKTTCTAAGTTFLLEFALLSRLTMNPIWETAAYRAIRSVWVRRSSISLVGALIDTETGKWIHEHSGIGAGIDSFYETLLKSSILIGDDDLFHWFDKAYQAVMEHTTIESLHLNIEVNMRQGKKQPSSFTISSLQAFWPALESLSGHISSAITSFDGLMNLWSINNALPDMFNLLNRSLYPVYGRDYPLRPEMIESAYQLYMVTKDAKYIEFGEKFLNVLESTCRVECGYASIADVSSGRLDDRMDSYFFAETLKYLYLLFDEAIEEAPKRKSIFCESGLDSESIGSIVDIPSVNGSLSLLMDGLKLLHQDESDHTADVNSKVNDTSSTRWDVVNFDQNDFINGISPFFMHSPAFASIDSSIFGERTTIQTNSFPYQMLNEDQLNTPVGRDKELLKPIRLKKKCVRQVAAVFSTEGHLFLLDPVLRSQGKNQREKKNPRKTNQCSVFFSSS